MHSLNKESQKRGIATEHAVTWHALEDAMGLPRGAATEHAKRGALHAHSDLSQSWIVVADLAESSARPSQLEDLMLRVDGDDDDVELQRVLALDILGVQAANALGNIYNLQMPKDVAETQQEETAVAATEHSEETTKRGDIIKPEDFLQESQEEAAAGAAAVATGAQRRDYP